VESKLQTTENGRLFVDNSVDTVDSIGVSAWQPAVWRRDHVPLPWRGF